MHDAIIEAVTSARIRPAARLVQEVLAETGRGDPRHGVYLAVLAEITQRGGGAGTPELWREASRTPAAAVESRLFFTVRWAEAVGASDSTQAYTQAVDLLQLMIWPGLARQDAERRLAEWSGLATDAAASAVGGGQCRTAVVLSAGAQRPVGAPAQPPR